MVTIVTILMLLPVPLGNSTGYDILPGCSVFVKEGPRKLIFKNKNTPFPKTLISIKQVESNKRYRSFTNILVRIIVLLKGVLFISIALECLRKPQNLCKNTKSSKQVVA